jgi:2-isopropylmalate synthase
VDKEISTTPKAYELAYLSVLAETGKGPKVAIRLKFKNKVLKGAGTGSGPVDAAYKIIDKMLRQKTRLLDYQIRSVTVGKDAQGEVTVKVQGHADQVILGQGVSTDVIEASVKAYLDAINKIVARAQDPKKGRAAHGV